MFGHLQIRSAYSFQSSTILIKDLVNSAKQKHMEALALCDLNNMYGAFEFSDACKKNGIKPIFGLIASIRIQGDIYPFILLSTDDQGYQDLVTITSDINLSAKKSISLKALKELSDHLIVISGSEDGIIERLILKEMEKEAEKYMRLFQKQFKHYYVMIQDHSLAMQKRLNKRLVSMADYVGVKVLCSNDVRYLRPQDAIAVDLMEASRDGVVLPADYEPMSTQRYLKDEAEMRTLFSDEIMSNTSDVLSFCKASIPENIKNLPNYPTPQHAPKDLYLKELCKVGLKKRFKGQRVPKKYVDRLSYELDIIHSMGFDDYFLIVWDYVQYSRRHQILVGPGRGSAAGSLVAYVLGITSIDPLAYDLLFERFLNPERVSMPDIDIDFQDDRRDEVVRYVIEKYGQDHVCQIVTFATYGPRVAIKDLGKVMKIPLPRLETIAKMVPTGPKNGKTITEMYNTSASFQSAINASPVLRKLIGPMSIVEHLPRNISMHAAGVVLSTRPLRESIPLVIGPSNMIMSQYSKDYIERAGLLKMDFLGLRNLTMIAYILKDMKEHEGISLDLNRIPLNDQKTYHMLSQADTFGVFQLESAGMRNLLRRMQPHQFNDIVDAIALYRPGPMENIPLYLKRRAHTGKIDYITPELEPVLKSTYGIIVYQEQIMQIAQIVAGFSLGRADVLRKAVSKKNAKTMAEMEDEFINGAIQQGYTRQKAKEIYDLIEKFANYGFNKSHSVAYAMIAYWLAYLKANQPLYFFASILSNSSAASSTRIHCIEEAKRYHVRILSPSVNHSADRFIVENGGIRYSLTAIKHVGYAGYKAIEEERKNGLFKDMADFLGRMGDSRMNYTMVNALISAGAFDEFNKNRAFLKENLITLSEYASLKSTLNINDPPVLKDVKESRYTRLEEEKEVLGIYLSDHPLTLVKRRLGFQVINLSDVNDYLNRQIQVLVAIDRVRVIVDKRGREMAFVEGSDDTGSEDFVCFATQYSTFRDQLQRGHVVLMQVRVQMRDRLSLVINNVKEINKNG